MIYTPKITSDIQINSLNDLIKLKPFLEDSTLKINKSQIARELGKEDVLLNITQVNGTYNEASVSYTYITRCTVNKMPVKRVLVEDYAAMWCWHCPVGLVATDALARRFPDDVVAVSVHKTDDISKVVSPTVYEGLIDRYAATLPAVWIARDNKAA